MPEGKKVGRPQKWDLDQLKILYPEIKTRRGLINQVHMLEAFSVLHGVEGLEFFINDKNRAVEHFCILTELGQLTSEADMIETAKYICEQQEAGNKRTDHEWARILRSIRIGK